jgi:hypothetical protein
MMTIVEDTVGCNDVTYARCSAFLYELHYGFDDPIAHSNCHDAFTEAIREWGLATDDVHDSFNGFMNTGVVDGRLRIGPMLAREGDRLSFLAQIDTLAVVVCCGGDLGATNNYELKGLAIDVRDATAAERGRLVEAGFVHQRRPPGSDAWKPARDPAFTAVWPWQERVAARHVVDVALSARETAALRGLKAGDGFGDFSDETMLRFLFFQWLERRHRRAGL